LIHLGSLFARLLVFANISGVTLASVSRFRSVRACLRSIACRDSRLRLACLFTGLSVAGGGSLDTAPVHGATRILTSLGALGIVSAISLALVGTVELTTIFLPASVVSIGNAIAMYCVVLPLVLIIGYLVVAIDVVVSIDVDVDVVIAPVTVAP
jgi:hypothetical protein